MEIGDIIYLSFVSTRHIPNYANGNRKHQLSTGCSDMLIWC